MARNRNNGGQVKQGDQADAPQESAQPVATEGAATAVAETAVTETPAAVDAASAESTVSGEPAQAQELEKQADVIAAVDSAVSEPVASEPAASGEDAGDFESYVAQITGPVLVLQPLETEREAEAAVVWAEAEVAADGDDAMAFDVLCAVALDDAKYPRGDVKCRRDAQRAIERCAAKCERFRHRAIEKSTELQAVGVEIIDVVKK